MHFKFLITMIVVLTKSCSSVREGWIVTFTFLKLFFSSLNLQSTHDVKGKKAFMSQTDSVHFNVVLNSFPLKSKSTFILCLK